MNNIDILEDFLDYYSYLKTAIGGDDIREFEIRIAKNELKAISNLIAENKELKEENEGLKTKLDTLIEKYKELKEMLKHRIEYTNKLEKDLFQNASNYVIPKSKVEEKIHQFESIRDEILKIEKELKRPSITYDLKRNDYCLKLLQELLEE